MENQLSLFKNSVRLGTASFHPLEARHAWFAFYAGEMEANENRVFCTHCNSLVMKKTTWYAHKRVYLVGNQGNG